MPKPGQPEASQEFQVEYGTTHAMQTLRWSHNSDDDGLIVESRCGWACDSSEWACNLCMKPFIAMHAHGDPASFRLHDPDGNTEPRKGISSRWLTLRIAILVAEVAHVLQLSCLIPAGQTGSF